MDCCETVKMSENEIVVPAHLAGCGRCAAIYRLLVLSYSPDRGAEYDFEAGQELLCDHCGMTACATNGCECRDVLCPHGRQHLREGA